MKAHVMSWLVTHLDGGTGVEEGTRAEEEEEPETTAVAITDQAERLPMSQLLPAGSTSEQLATTSNTTKRV